MDNPRIFIRDDDVWTLDASFRFFFEHALESRIPVIYAVIPGKIEPRLVRFLKRAKEKQPDSIDIVQHGWMHHDHSKNEKSKYEFGPGRALKIQREEVRMGLQRMRDLFGDLFTPVFVPPFHNYNKHTLQAIKEAGFRFFSAGRCKRAWESGLPELPAAVSFSRYDTRMKDIHAARQIVETLIREVSRHPLSGVVAHHADFTSAFARKQLVLFFQLISKLMDRSELRVTLFSDLRSLV